ncbi:uncharacterized protein N0V89_000048 [Didymosphaeria variabile]|uniref:Uncharacterized protein n=1 Tax=Didymosphaeria variabile TaxID=1932322 RepID=A0A9W9CFB9_9PLEO|nr:uncharacterized protein N0V89_000048 [Didymosphaeria variabile]KAJ4359494.1 hypothetical protein N0V89_000048 [Didymosphaeria variabile]
MRAYFMFFSYLGLCFSLSVFIIYKLVQKYNVLSRSTTGRLPAKAHIRTFAILAALSLFTTWYYMSNYFRVSYQAWAMWRSRYEISQDKMHWGLWLKETSLFREAWETIVVGNARYWWSHQIFFFASGLGLSLEERGVRRGIKYTWAFMLLGQIVSVSFATNLYLLTLLLTPSSPPPSTSTGIYRRKWLGPWLINLLSIVFTIWPAYQLADEHYWYHQTEFMPMLLTAHVALLVMPLLRAVVPSKYLSDSNVEFAGTVYKFLWAANNFGGGLLFTRVTATAYKFSGPRGVWQQLWEHPAVSSVAFDAIFCWITWGTWWAIQMRTISTTPALDDDEKEGEGTGVGSGRADVVPENNGAMRRR